MTGATNDAPFFHVGVLVADIDAAIGRFSEMLGLSFAPVMHAPVQLRNTEHDLEVTMTATYSVQGPPHIELIQGHGDGIFSLAGGERIHHLGCWSPGLDASSSAAPPLCLPILYSVHPVPGQPPGMLLSDPASLHGAVMGLLDDRGRPMLDAWLAGRPPEESEVHP
jgi:hypothetical protein